jgi:hypothetical protein
VGVGAAGGGVSSPAAAAEAAAVAQLTSALLTLPAALASAGLDPSHLLYVRLYTSDMRHYKAINGAYGRLMQHAPAARACVQIPLGCGGGRGEGGVGAAEGRGGVGGKAAASGEKANGERAAVQATGGEGAAVGEGAGGEGAEGAKGRSSPGASREGGSGGAARAHVSLEVLASWSPKRHLHVSSISEWAPRMVSMNLPFRHLALSPPRYPGFPEQHLHIRSIADYPPTRSLAHPPSLPSPADRSLLPVDERMRHRTRLWQPRPHPPHHEAIRRRHGAPGAPRTRKLGRSAPRPRSRQPQFYWSSRLRHERRRPAPRASHLPGVAASAGGCSGRRASAAAAASSGGRASCCASAHAP